MQQTLYQNLFVFPLFTQYMFKYTSLKYLKPTISQLKFQSRWKSSSILQRSGVALSSSKVFSTKQETSGDTENTSFYSQFGEVNANHHPLIYSKKYNISFYGLEKFHPFDSCKYQNIVKHLIDKNAISSDTNLITVRNKVSDEVLKEVHTERYLNSLRWSAVVAKITELPFLAFFPNWLVQKTVLNPMRYATSGSILAGKVAMERGHAINLGGGFHHCSADCGGGFCPFADISLSIHYLRQQYSQVKKVMIIDLDAHQGNGHEHDKLSTNDSNLYILDMYNRSIYPHDFRAKRAIDCQVEVENGIGDAEYLRKLKTALENSFKECSPDVIYYNAGTDILEGDPLGNMNVTKEGVKKRDEMVFQYAKDRKVPIVMMLSGGYQRHTAEIIADSIQNLDSKFKVLS